jgi:hypothetical protein
VRESKENAGRNVNKEGQEGLILNSGRFHISRGRGQRGERTEQRESEKDYRTGLHFTFYEGLYSVQCTLLKGFQPIFFFWGGGGVVKIPNSYRTSCCNSSLLECSPPTAEARVGRHFLFFSQI